MLIEVITDHLNGFCRPLLPGSDLRNGLVKIAQIGIERTLNKFNHFTQFYVAAIKAAHLI